MVVPCLEAASMLETDGYSVGVVNMRFIKPLDRDRIHEVLQRTKRLVTVEENVLAGGFGAAVQEYILDTGLTGVRVKRLGLPDQFIEHGKRSVLLQVLGLDSEGIARTLKEELQR